VGPGTGLNKRKIFLLMGLELHSLGRPAGSQSLSRLVKGDEWKDFLVKPQLKIGTVKSSCIITIGLGNYASDSTVP
jgi:hypothetical protein